MDKRELGDPDEEEELGVPRFPVGTRLMLRVPSGGLRHGALLEYDRSGWVSLRPNPRWTETELDGIPVFNQDEDRNPPPKVSDFKRRIREADAILFVTPEYNYSVPGVLKNAID